MSTFASESPRTVMSPGGNFRGQFVPFPPHATVAANVAHVRAQRTSAKRTLSTCMLFFEHVTYAKFETPFAPSYKVIRGHREIVDATIAPEGDDADTSLQLSITVPNTAKVNSDLPVVVMIHGGGYQFGTRDEPWFSGSGFARNNVITVSVSYRLGLKGFVPFANDEPNHYRGIDDCQNALEWIQKNIEDFGGDPTNVTLMGQSAGAGIALWLARRDHYRGTFRRVWAMSPGIPRTHFSKRKGRLRSILSTPVTKSRIEALRPSKLAKGEKKFVKSVKTDLPLGPAPFDATQLTAVPIVITCTGQEFFNFGPAKKLDSAAWAKPLRGGLVRILGGKKYTPRGAKDSTGERYFGQLITDNFFRRLVEQTARLSDGRVWVIEYEGTENRGVYHCSDIPWVFGNTEELEGTNWQIFKEPEESMLADVHTLAVDFVHGEKPAWKNYAQNAAVLTMYPGGVPEDVLEEAENSDAVESRNAHSVIAHDPFANVRAAFPVKKF